MALWVISKQAHLINKIMNEYYDFFKDFAGVTEKDLQQYKCGGKAKKACGGMKARKFEKGQKVKPDTDNEFMMVGEKVDPNYSKAIPEPQSANSKVVPESNTQKKPQSASIFNAAKDTKEKVVKAKVNRMGFNKKK